MPYTKQFYTDLYKMMQRIRLCEESLIEPILKGDIRCPVHLYTGQEAIATGVCAALEKTDYIFGNHRSHGHYLAKGGDMGTMLAEIYGREGGCSRGRGGSMHLIDLDNGIMGVAPIVGGMISLAAGAALVSKILKNNKVTVIFFGDGATGEGILYETLNFAALKKLPLIFICENNLYSTHLPVSEIRVSNNISEIAKPFNIETFTSDGNDVIKVHELAKKAIQTCRAQNGPVFIEFLTYRLRGHVGPNDNVQGDKTDIRPRREIEAWEKKDPIKKFKSHLLECGTFTPYEISEMDTQCMDEVLQANNYAIQSKMPDPVDLEKYVFKK